MKKTKLTDSEIKKIPFAEKGKQADYYDSELDGFGLRVSATGKKYFVRAYVGGKRTRVMMKNQQLITAADARREAIAMLGDMSKGVDPNEAERQAIQKKEQDRIQEEVRSVTLQSVLDSYLDKRPLKPATVTVMKTLFRLYLADWLKLPVEKITKKMVSDRHAKIAKGQRSRPLVQGTDIKDQPLRKATADNALRALRTVLNFHQGDDEAFLNPVRILSRRREWYKVSGRRTLIKNTDLPAWYKAVEGLENGVMRDYLLFLLFTGLRRKEAATLKWKQVDFEEGSFTVLDTKNKLPHTLPLSDYLHNMLKVRLEGLKTELAEAKAALAKTGLASLRDQQTARNRFALAESRFKSPYVFPGEGATGYIVEPRRAIDMVTETTGVNFTCHDLRRTFATLAESLDLSRFTVKELLNHKQHDNDVTSGYIVLTVERLRVPMQKITDAFLERVKVKHGQVIQIRKGAVV